MPQLTSTAVLQKNARVKNKWIFILFIALLAGFATDIAVGTVAIPLKEVVKIIFGYDTTDLAWQNIVTKIRIPKAITAILAGCSLAVAGLKMQTLFKNPLAGPDVLGISPGAGLGVALVMLTTGGATGMYTIRQTSLSGSWLIILAASIGAAAVLVLILSISLKVANNVMLLVIGIMVGVFTTSIVSLWLYFSSPEQIQEYLLWTFGSIGGVSGEQLYIFFSFTLAGILLSLAASKSLNMLLLGENYARSMGLSVKQSRILIISGTSLLAGSTTAFCGPIGFIGLAAPHLGRLLLNTSDHRILIPACCLIGANLMLFCDIISQVNGTQTVLPVNVVTAFIGAPIVVSLIVNKRNTKSVF
jgi:iron complex transport system permease protein